MYIQHNSIAWQCAAIGRETEVNLRTAQIELVEREKLPKVAVVSLLLEAAGMLTFSYLLVGILY